MLSACYALRYEVYCKERQFLTPENYPTKLEIDSYDKHSIHVGGTDNHGVMVGTVRLVLPSAKGFPLFEHCELFPTFQYLATEGTQQTTAEISRLAISKSYRRRLHDGFYGHDYEGDLNVAKTSDRRSVVSNDEDRVNRRHKPEIIGGLYKAMYQASKRQGITHWFAAMEKPLWRLIHRCFRVEFIPIGPELDYYGPVIPYIIAIADLEETLREKCPSVMEDFLDGLEPEFAPLFRGTI